MTDVYCSEGDGRPLPIRISSWTTCSLLVQSATDHALADLTPIYLRQTDSHHIIFLIALFRQLSVLRPSDRVYLAGYVRVSSPAFLESFAHLDQVNNVEHACQGINRNLPLFLEFLVPKSARDCNGIRRPFVFFRSSLARDCPWSMWRTFPPRKTGMIASS